HGFSARDGDPSFADFEHFRVLADLPHRLRDGDRLAVVLVPGIRVMTILAAKRATCQKSDKAQARTIHRAAYLPRVNVADDVICLLNLISIRRIDGKIVTRCLALGCALVRDMKVVAAAYGWLAHAFLLRGAVEGAIDDVELLLLGQLDEVDRIAGHPNRELRILLRVLHRIL